MCAIITFVYFPPFFPAVHIVEWLASQTIYVVNKAILQCLGLKSGVKIESGLLWRKYYTYLFLIGRKDINNKEARPNSFMLELVRMTIC